MFTPVATLPVATSPAAPLSRYRRTEEPMPAGYQAVCRTAVPQPPADPLGTDEDLWPWVPLPGGGLELLVEAA